MNLENFVTCSQCLRELHPTIQYEIEHAMIHNYHCEQCCFTFSIYSITKTRLAEIQATPHPATKMKALLGKYPYSMLLEEELEVREQHEMEDK